MPMFRDMLDPPNVKQNPTSLLTKARKEEEPRQGHFFVEVAQRRSVSRAEFVLVKSDEPKVCPDIAWFERLGKL